jgi:hypothetical protein
MQYLFPPSERTHFSFLFLNSKNSPPLISSNTKYTSSSDQITSSSRTKFLGLHFSTFLLFFPPLFFLRMTKFLQQSHFRRRIHHVQLTISCSRQRLDGNLTTTIKNKRDDFLQPVTSSLVRRCTARLTGPQMPYPREGPSSYLLELWSQNKRNISAFLIVRTSQTRVRRIAGPARRATRFCPRPQRCS